MARKTALDDDAVLRSLVQDMQRELDQAETSHRAALAAHRRAGDKLVELSNALRHRTEGAANMGQRMVAGQDASPPAKADRDPERQIDPVLVSVREAMRIAGLGRSSLYQLLSDGQFVARKIGSRTLIEYASLKAWVNALPTFQGR